MNHIIRRWYQLSCVRFFYQKMETLYSFLRSENFCVTSKKTVYFILYCSACRWDFRPTCCPFRFKGPVSLPFVWRIGAQRSCNLCPLILLHRTCARFVWKSYWNLEDSVSMSVCQFNTSSLFPPRSVFFMMRWEGRVAWMGTKKSSINLGWEPEG
jgi:hypothetical protein